MHKSAMLLAVLASLTTIARADSYSPADLEALDKQLHDVAPLPGLERAPNRPPAWCAHVQPESGYSIGGFVQAIEDPTDSLRAAKVACSFPGNDKSVQHAAAIIEQRWINASGLSDSDAVMSITIRLDEARYDNAKTQLCSKLVVSDEVDGEDALFMKTRSHLLGCDGNYPSWRADQPPYPDAMAGYLDQSANPPDEIVKLGYSLEHVKSAFEDPRLGDPTRYVKSYGIASYDAHTLSKPNLDRMLATPPYKDNVYARATLIESFAHAKMGIAILDARAKKLASDPDWKEFLFEAPRRGATQFLDAAKAHPEELARSNAFEHALDGGSRKRIAGCAQTLYPDFMTVFGGLDHTTVEAATASLSDPIASLLFQRLVTCLIESSDPAASDLASLRNREVRYSRGPRTAIYFAQLEALAKIRADRPKFPLDASKLAFDFRPIGEGGARGGVATAGSKGIIKSASKKGGVIHVEFPKKMGKYMDRACEDTNHLIQIRGDGTLQWEQRCHDLGWKSMDLTAPPVDVPVAYAHGIIPGAYIETTGSGFPSAVYTDASKKKLVNFYGFPL
jgi:hypothetical protein